MNAEEALAVRAAQVREAEEAELVAYNRVEEAERRHRLAEETLTWFDRALIVAVVECVQAGGSPLSVPEFVEWCARQVAEQRDGSTTGKYLAEALVEKGLAHNVREDQYGFYYYDPVDKAVCDAAEVAVYPVSGVTSEYEAVREP